MTRRNFSLQNENDCKVQLRFVKCCTLELAVTETRCYSCTDVRTNTLNLCDKLLQPYKWRFIETL